MNNSLQLEEARNETNDSLKKLSQVENELFETKQQYRQQEEELQRKSSLFIYIFLLFTSFSIIV